MDNRGDIALAIIFVVVALTLLRTSGASVDFYEDGTALGQRTGHNLVSGAGINITGTDAPANSRVNITVSAIDNAASGSATVSSGNLFVMVTHGLGSTPDRVQLTPTTDPADAAWYVSSKGASQFAITLVATHSSDITFDWRASKEE